VDIGSPSATGAQSTLSRLHHDVCIGAPRAAWTGMNRPDAIFSFGATRAVLPEIQNQNVGFEADGQLDFFMESATCAGLGGEH
jgi:hypothetical protein